MQDEKFFVPLSAEAKGLLVRLNQKLRPVYINDRIANGVDHFIGRYQKIKDESWPCCNGYEDFYTLPEHIKQECVIEHKFSPEIFFKSIEQDANYHMPNHLHCLAPVIKMLNQNVNLLTNNRIIDFACKWGVYSFFAADNTDRALTGIDVRDDNILIANTIQQTTKYKNCDNLNFQIGDMHNYENNIRLCSNTDVIFLFGILYHVHDHYDILRSTCLSNVKTVFIETGIHNDIDPTIFWKIEPTFEMNSGYIDGKVNIPVGYPSVSYLDIIMNSLGYHQTYHAQHHVSISASMTNEFMMPRACLVYQR